MICKHCRNGFLENKFGQDVRCVNGVLIDIDEAHEGWQLDVDYSVAPCHPMWTRQQAGDEDFPNDSQERLAAWAEVGIEDTANDAFDTPPISARVGVENP